MNGLLSSRRDEALKELNIVYKDYLETKLIYQTLYEVISSLSDTDDALCDENAKTILNNYWRTYLLSQFEKTSNDVTSLESCASSQFNLVDDLKCERLDDEQTAYVVSRLENAFESKLNAIEELMNCDDNVKTSQPAGDDDTSFDDWLSNEKFIQLDDLNDLEMSPNKISSSSSRVNLDKLLENFRALGDSIEDLDAQSRRLSDDISVKLEHCVRISIEALKCMKKLLGDYRIGFYSQQNKMSCQHQLIKCETVLAKIMLVSNELVNDMYTGEKVKSLRFVKNHIQLESTKAGDKCKLAKSSLDEFRSLGNEFDQLLATYVTLRNELAQKKWTLGKLVEDEHL